MLTNSALRRSSPRGMKIIHVKNLVGKNKEGHLLEGDVLLQEHTTIQNYHQQDHMMLM